MVITYLPNGLMEIDDEAFFNDTSLEAVIIPDGCRRIGDRAFADCKNLLYVRIPENANVSNNAFGGSNKVAIDKQ